MTFAHNNPHLGAQSTLMSLWFYSAASNQMCTNTFITFLTEVLKKCAFLQKVITRVKVFKQNIICLVTCPKPLYLGS